jgi:hypothetical protein
LRELVLASAEVAGTREFDLDDLGAEVTEGLGGQRAEFDLGEVEHAHMIQGQAVAGHPHSSVSEDSSAV